MTPVLDYAGFPTEALAHLQHPAGTVYVTAPSGISASLAEDGETVVCTVTSRLESTWTGIVGIFLDVPLAGAEPFFLLPSFIYGSNRAEEPVHAKAKRWPRLRQATPAPVLDYPFSSYFTVRGDRLTCPVAMARVGDAAYGLSGPVYPSAPSSEADAGVQRAADTPRGKHARGTTTLDAPHSTASTGNPAAAENLVAGFGCAWLSDRARLIFTVGHENAPWLYVSGQLDLGDSRDKASAPAAQPHDSPQSVPPGGYLTLPPGGRLRLEIGIHRVRAGGIDDNRCFSQIIRAVSQGAHQEPRHIAVELGAPKPASSVDEIPKAVDLLAGALFEHAYYEPAHNYCTTLTEQDGEVIQDTNSFSISWTGGLSVAVPLLISAHRMRTDTAAESRVRDWNAVRLQALECIQHFCRTSRNPASGLPFDAFRSGEWTTNGWWEEYVWALEGKRGHSSYLVGEALYYLLLAYDVEKTHGSPRPDWLVFAKTCLAAAEGSISDADEYPYIWSSETGVGLEYDAFCGAGMTAARAYEYAITGSQVALESARRTLSAYHHHVRRLLCYGAPHDTWKAPDQEGVLGFIKAARLLHKATGSSYYLECLRDGLDYELSWQYCYNTRPERPPLSAVGWSSSGGSVTSVANQCVHPMGLIVLDDLGWYFEQTGNPYYQDRARHKLLWALQSFNRYDGEYDHGLAGWLSERFDASPIMSIDSYPDGSPASTWFVAHPWAAGCILEALTGRFWRKDV